MALFKKEEKAKTKLELFLNEVEKLKNNLYDSRAKSQVIDYLERIIKGQTISRFEDEELLIEVLKSYLSLNIEYNEDLMPYIVRVKYLFDMVYLTGKTEGYPNFDLFLKLFEPDGIIDKNLFNINFYRMFINNTNFYILMEALSELSLTDKDFTKIIDFFISIRGRYTDEIEYKMDLLDFLNQIIYQSDIDSLINKKQEYLDKRDGIYSINETDLDMIHEKLRGAGGFCATLEDLIKRASDLTASLKNRTDKYRSDLTRINDDSLSNYIKFAENETQKLRREIETFKDEISAYKAIKEGEIDEIIKRQIENVFTKLNAEKTRIINSLQTYETALSTLALRKSEELSSLGENQISKLHEMLANQSELQDLISGSVPSKETISLIIEATKDLSELKSLKETITHAQLNTPNILSGTLNAPTVIRPFQDVDFTVNKYFDKKRSFTSRIQEIKEKMEKNEKEKGIIYHKQTLKIITALIEDVPPYLYGPSGGGKSMIVSMVADLLELPFIDVGYITEEYQVKGAEPFLGNFKPSSIHECFQLGKMGFIDEFDNGNAKACVSLNPFLRHSDNYYTFANGERVRRHPNFRMITAGNTIGDGATKNHPTREAIEESVLQRLTLFYIDYDENVEKSLLRDFPEWYNFIIAFRNAQRTWEGNYGEITLTGAVTTSDIDKINGYLKDESFTIEEIIGLDFIQKKSRDYLEAIGIALEEHYSKPCQRKELNIYNTFKKEVKKYYSKRGF